MLLFYLSLPFYLKNSNFLYWMVLYHTQIYILTQFRDAKIDIFDMIEKNVILCVLEMSAFGTTFMAMSLLVILCLGINLNILQRTVVIILIAPTCSKQGFLLGFPYCLLLLKNCSGCNFYDIWICPLG